MKSLNPESSVVVLFTDSIDRAEQRHRRDLRKSTLGHQAALDELAEVWEECRNAGWDGYQALPVNQDTLRNAYCVIESLPLGFPTPTIGAEATGALTLEWYLSARRILSVSMTPDGELYYAALLGPNRVHGMEAFFGEMPKPILDLIRRVCAI